MAPWIERRCLRQLFVGLARRIGVGGWQGNVEQKVQVARRFAWQATVFQAQFQAAAGTGWHGNFHHPPVGVGTCTWAPRAASVGVTGKVM